jgi:hypothetical protein
MDNDDEQPGLSPDRQKLLEELKDARTLDNALKEQDEGKGEEERKTKRRKEKRPRKT